MGYLIALSLIGLMLGVAAGIWFLLARSDLWEQSRVGQTLVRGGPFVWLGILCLLIALILVATRQLMR